MGENADVVPEISTIGDSSIPPSDLKNPPQPTQPQPQPPSKGYPIVMASDVLYMRNAVRPVARLFWDALTRRSRSSSSSSSSNSGADSDGDDDSCCCVGVLVDPGRCWVDEFVETCHGMSLPVLAEG